MSKKEKFPLYLSPEKKAILERRYQEDGSRSITAFIERAVDFYLDYLSANNAGLFLPTSIKSYLDGRLGQLEKRLSSLAFRQAVEQDMVAGILADAYQFSDEDLRRRRYDTWEWNYGASPACSALRRRRVEGCGTVEAYLRTDRGRLTDVQFRGDFFSAVEPEVLARRLIGLRPEEKELRAALEGVDAGLYFTGLDTETLLDILCHG